MSDLIYTLEYIKVPHPLKEEESIVAGENYQLQKTLYKIYPYYKNPRYNLPRLERKIFVSSENQGDLKTLEKEVSSYEKNLIENLKKKIYLRIIKVWLRLGVSFAASYLIWTLLWRFPWLYSAIDSCFRTVGDFLSPYAVTTIILAPSIAFLYFSFTGKNSLIKMYRGLKPFEIYHQLGKDHSYRFIKELERLKKNLKKEIGENNPLIEELKSLQETLYNKKWNMVEDILRQILETISSDPEFPWGEKKNIAAMVEDALYQLRNKFKFAPLKVISNLNGNLSPTEEKKLLSLSKFLSSKEFVGLRNKIIKDYSLLREANSTMKRIEITHKISSHFQRMIFLCSRYHMGENFLPYERGTTLKNLYHELFVSFGKASHFLRKKKPGNLVSHNFIKKLQRKVEITFNFNKEKTNSCLLGLIANPAGGILISFGILICAAMLTGFYFLNPDETSIIHHYRFGYQGFLGEEIYVKNYSCACILKLQNLKLFWEPPKPFYFVHNVNSKKIYSTDVFMILRETEPSGLLDRFFHLFREEWGRGYSGIDFHFAYRVINPELWAKYDYDGKGRERLSRDLEYHIMRYMEKKRVNYQEKLYRENSAEIKSHFKKCLIQGKVKEWIRRFLYPSPLDTYRTGSMYERYLAGLRWLKEHPRMKGNPEWQKFVEHEIKNIEKLNQEENEELIYQPLKVKKIMKNPTIAKLETYENLYRTIYYLVVEDLINDKIIEEVKNGENKGVFGNVRKEVVDWVHRNSRIEQLIGIEITDVKPLFKKISALGWQNELRKKQNLI